MGSLYAFFVGGIFPATVFFWRHFPCYSVPLQWICGHSRRDRVRNDNIRERLWVTPVEEKLMQHRLRWFGHIQRRPTDASICNGVIRRTGNKKRDRRWSNWIWEQSVKKDLKDWCIIKELPLDRREWKLAIHMLEPWSSVPSFYFFLTNFFPASFSLFWLSVLFLFFFLIWFFYHPLFSPFLLLFYTYFFMWFYL
jgi:hypothetical protein